MRPRAIPSRPPPDSSPRWTICPISTAAPFHFPERYQQSLQLARKGVRTLRHHHRRPPVRHGRRACRLHARHHLRRPGRHVAGASRPRLRRYSRCLSVPVRWRRTRFSPVAPRRDRRSAAWRRSGSNRAALPSRHRAGLVRTPFWHARSPIGYTPWFFRAASSKTNCSCEDLKSLLEEAACSVWTNRAVPANDGGISLGQAALAAFGRFDKVYA